MRGDPQPRGIDFTLNSLRVLLAFSLAACAQPAGKVGEQDVNQGGSTFSEQQYKAAYEKEIEAVLEGLTFNINGVKASRADVLEVSDSLTVEGSTSVQSARVSKIRVVEDNGEQHRVWGVTPKAWNGVDKETFFVALNDLGEQNGRLHTQGWLLARESGTNTISPVMDESGKPVVVADIWSVGGKVVNTEIDFSVGENASDKGSILQALLDITSGDVYAEALEATPTFVPPLETATEMPLPTRTPTSTPSATETQAATPTPKNEGWASAIEQGMGCVDKTTWWSEKYSTWQVKVVSDGELITEPVELAVSDTESVTMLVGWKGHYCVNENGVLAEKSVVVPSLIRLPDGRLYRYGRDDFPNWSDEEILRRAAISNSSDVWNEPGGGLTGGIKGEMVMLFITPDVDAEYAAYGIAPIPGSYRLLADSQEGFFASNVDELTALFKQGDDRVGFVFPRGTASAGMIALP